VTYTLKQPDIDLVRHVRTEKGVRRYHLPKGSPIIGHHRPTGKHLTGSEEFEDTQIANPHEEFEKHAERIDALLTRVKAGDASSESVDESVWTEASARLAAMSRIAKEREAAARAKKRAAARAAATGKKAAVAAAVVGGTYALKDKVPAGAVDTAKEWGLTLGGMHLVSVATNVAAAAVGLIGAEASSHFVESFHKLIENPTLEAGIVSAAAVLVATLIARIRKALSDRRDRRIAKARSALPSS
jgi:hypothetical protein